MSYPNTTTPEDLRKLHSECNQLRNQQFTLATIGIASVALSSWMTLIPLSNGAKTNSQAVISLFLFALLGLLYRWSMVLRQLIGIISMYLELRDGSEWERHFRAFWKEVGSFSCSQTVALTSFYALIGSVPLGEYLGVAIFKEHTSFRNTHHQSARLQRRTETLPPAEDFGCGVQDRGA
jgi:hypothetical protein